MKTVTNYRMLNPGEPVERGDEFYYMGKWRPSGNYVYSPYAQDRNTQYRRPLPATPAFVPQWRHPDAPSCPVHVLWAESPSTVRTVAQVAAEAKPKAVEPGTGYRLLGPEEMVLAGDHFHGHRGAWVDVEGTIGQKQGECGWVIRRKIKAVGPGTGYRLLGDDEIIEKGDQWNNGNTCWSMATGSIGKKAGSMALVFRRKLPAPLCPIDPPAGYYILGPDEVWQEGDLIGDGIDRHWEKLMPYNFGTATNTWKRCKEPRWCCRKLPVPEPQYRPYANAEEAAAGLQGKLIYHINEPGNYYPPLSVDDAGIRVGSGHRYTMIGLKEYWKFTDGTPCGVLTTNQGTK